MPDDANNIYVDLTFSAPADGSEDVTTELSLAEADVIGAYNMPVVYTASDYDAITFKSIDTEYTVGSGINLGLEVDTEYFSTAGATISGIYVSLVDYDSGSTVASGSRNEYVDCFLTDETGISDRTKEVIVDYIIGYETSWVLSAIVEFLATTSISGNKELTTEYYRPPPIYVAIDSTTDITFSSMSTMSSGDLDVDVDLTFAGWVNYPWQFDLYCAVSGTNYIDSELTVISGAINHYLTEIICGVSGTQNFNIDLYCCLVDYAIANYEVTVISGTIDKLDYEVYSCEQVIDPLIFDVDLLSLKISNFVPSADAYVQADGRISVDITDDIYSVLTSASGIPCSGTCCLKVDGTAVSVTFSGIADGYRMYYDPSDDFESLMDSTEFLVHAENSNGDILERSYYLTFGYFVDYDNRPRFGIDYDYGGRVVVRMSAEDLATCPTFSADAYWFDSEERKVVDLGASIVGVPPEIVSDSEDLSASIYPESLAFFYGKVFRVVLDCKDFAGNEMETYEFEFQIEDAPS